LWFVIKFSKYAWIRRKDIRGVIEENSQISNKNFFDNFEKSVRWVLGLRPVFRPARVVRWIVFGLLASVLTQSLLAANGYVFAHFISGSSRRDPKDFYFTEEGFARGLRCKVVSPAATQTVWVFNTTEYGLGVVNDEDLRVLSGSWMIVFWPEIALRETAKLTAKGWTLEQFKEEHQILLSAKDEVLQRPLMNGSEVEKALDALKILGHLSYKPQSKLLTVSDMQGGWSEELKFYDDQFKVLIKDDKVWLCRCSNYGSGWVSERIYHWDPKRGVSTSSSMYSRKHASNEVWSIPMFALVFFAGILLVTAPFCWLTFKGPPIIVNDEESLP
jgi:hypothetical protein